ncbi:MAG: hypothetical protein QMD95_02980, partial [Candidatus Hodarchaeaceae archaeon]|nr:hypothetical protein [Candidatus Hodarchaeaceae archaeon]
MMKSAARSSRGPCPRPGWSSRRRPARRCGTGHRGIQGVVVVGDRYAAALGERRRLCDEQIDCVILGTD